MQSPEIERLFAILHEETLKLDARYAELEEEFVKMGVSRIDAMMKAEGVVSKEIKAQAIPFIDRLVGLMGFSKELERNGKWGTGILDSTRKELLAFARANGYMD